MRKISNFIDRCFDRFIDFLNDLTEKIDAESEKMKLLRKDYEDLNDKFDKQLNESVNKLIELAEENVRYRRVLEFYADEENYAAPYLYTPDDGIPVHDESEIDIDHGRKAREELEGSE